MKKDRVFELELYEMVLFDRYEAHKAYLENSDNRVSDIRLLRAAKEEIDLGRIEVIEGDQ